MKNNVVTLVLIIISFSIGYFLIPRSETSVKVPVEDQKMLSGSSFKCESVSSAYLYGSIYDQSMQADLHTNGDGDTIAMEVKTPKQLSVITTTAVKSGMTEGNRLAIFQNDNKRIRAFEDYNGITFSMVNIDKETGRGVMIKSSSGFGESGYVSFLKCR